MDEKRKVKVTMTLEFPAYQSMEEVYTYLLDLEGCRINLPFYPRTFSNQMNVIPVVKVHMVEGVK